MRTTPLVGCSSVPMTCSSVDLPEPDGPTIATSSPRPTENDTPSSATTGGCSPDTFVPPPPPRPPSSPRPAPAPVRRSRRRDQHALALAQRAFDLDAPVRVVEEARPHRD